MTAKPSRHFHRGLLRPAVVWPAATSHLDLDQLLASVRRAAMVEALRRAEGVQTEAAKLLGVSFRSFRYYRKVLGGF